MLCRLVLANGVRILQVLGVHEPPCWAVEQEPSPIPPLTSWPELRVHLGMNEPPPLPPMPPAVPDFKDRRAGLKVFGVLEILCGALAGLMTLFALFSVFMASRHVQNGMALWQVIATMIWFPVAAVALIWLGVGSLQARRWAHALSLVVSWSWLLFGVWGLSFYLFYMPSPLKAAPPQGQMMPEGTQMVAMLFALVFGVFFLVVVPTIFVSFYQSRHVKVTCEVHDPVPRWTDACPLPVLMLSLWFGFGALLMLVALPASPKVELPVLGWTISGPVGWLGCMGVVVGLGYSAWAMYRLRKSGWWTALGLVCIGATSVILDDSVQLHSPPQPPSQTMGEHTPLPGHPMVFMSLGIVIPLIGLLLFVRRCFHHRAEAVSQA